MQVNEIVLADANYCTGCTACSSICPCDAIAMNQNSEGFFRPVINADRCTRCGLCVKTCPAINSVLPPSAPVAVCAAMHADEEIRLKSSSGGIFSALAETTLAEGGVVFGAAFDEAFRVHHISVSNVDQLDQLRGSKYVQSDLEQIFKEVRDFLQIGRRVLFTGTPCQIAGLKRFLGTADSLLVCVDLICHGVPSPLTWKAYLKMLPVNLMKRVSFRDKRKGWHAPWIRIESSSGTDVVYQPFGDNSFGRAFLWNFGLGLSCYDCQFKNGKSGSDLTMGDFWGVGSVAPHLDDDKGVSILFVHSRKGQELIARSRLRCTPVEATSAAKNNCYLKSVAQPRRPSRQWFFREVSGGNLRYAAWVIGFVLWISRFLARAKGKVRKIFRLQ